MAAINLNVSIDENDYLQAQAFFNALHTDLESVFKEVVSQAVKYDRIPEFVQAPYNEETLDSFREMEDIASGRTPAKVYNSVEELFADLEAEGNEE